jgi:hypothetical protein
MHEILPQFYQTPSENVAKAQNNFTFLIFTTLSRIPESPSQSVTMKKLTVIHQEDMFSTVKNKYNYLFKAQWELYVPPASTITNSAFCVYGFRIIHSANRDYFLKQR